MYRTFVSQHRLTYRVKTQNYTDAAHNNLDTHQPLLEIIGRDVAYDGYYKTVISFSTSINQCTHIWLGSRVVSVQKGLGSYRSRDAVG